MHPCSNRLTVPALLGLCLVLLSPAWPAAAQTSPREAPGAEAVQRQLGRELARLDDKLDLGTFPDGSPLWPARLAASIERRTAPGSKGAEAVPGRELLRRLADDLRALGADQPLVGPPELQPAANSTPAGAERRARLRDALETARLLNRKLDRLGAPAEDLATRSAPANDDCASATSIGAGTYTGSTADATIDGTATCGASTISPDVWYHFTATADGQVLFDTYGSSYDTVLSLHTACPGSGRDVELDCSDDANGTSQSAVSLDMTSGDDVWVRVSGFGGASGSYTLHVAEIGGISGTVTRKDTGADLAGVTVKIYDHYGYYVTETQSAADGTYQVPGLVPGTYYAEAFADGFIDQIYDGIMCPSYSSCHPNYDGTAIAVVSGVTGGIDFSMTPGGSISGVLTDQATGDPLSGYAYLYLASGTYSVDSVQAGADGSYKLTGILPGKYYVKAQASDHQAEVYDDVACPGSCDVTTGTQIPVTLGSDVTGIDFALTRLGAIGGTVHDQTTSAPIDGQELFLYDSQGVFEGITFTTGDGSYRLQGLLPATYFVRTFSSTNGGTYADKLYDDLPCDGGCTVTGGTPIAVSLASTTSGIDFTLTPRGKISGVVTDAGTGAPLPNLRLFFYGPAGDYVENTSSGEGGVYTSPGLPATDYFVVTDADSGYQNEVYDDLPCAPSCSPTSGTPVAVALATTTSGIDFALERLGRIQGSVTAADGGSPLYAQVYAYDSTGQQVGYGYTSSGLFDVSSLAPGLYYLKAAYRGAPDEYEDTVYPAVPCEPTCDVSQGTPVSVALNTTVVGLDFALPRCSLDSFIDLYGLDISSTYSAEACRRVSATATTVHVGAAVTFRAGREIVLGNGFAVQSGASFQAVVDPSVIQP